ncbi:MAG: SDR family oxidoreductase [Limisphaerales bacterium]
MRFLIVGCGYVGLPVGVELVRQGHEVVGIRRSPEGAEAIRLAGMEPVIGDITAGDFAVPEGRFDGVVFAASAGDAASASTIRALLMGGLARLAGDLAKDPPKRFVFAGSKSVYGQRDGSLVKETSVTDPEGERAKVWVEAERWLLGAAGRAVSPVILRLGDIYGPGRERFVEEFAKNRLKIPGQGQRHLNMIHRDDAVGVILAALKNGRVGEVYNAVDDEPIRETQFFSWLAETLGKWMPPNGPEETDPDRRPELANCKVSNRRLTMELGYRLKYPNFRQGYTAEIKRMTDDGTLEIVPEQR